MVRILTRTLLVTVLFFVSLTSAMANTLTATVSSNQVTKAEVFQLRLTYDDKIDSDRIDFSVLQNQFFLGQPSFGSSLNYVNGKRSSRSEWTIALKAKQLGTISIPSFSIDGASSQPIVIKVSQDKDLPKPSELVTIQAQLDKKSLYPNEATQLKTRLIIKSDPRRLQDVKISPPAGKSFTVEQEGEPNQYQTIINGVEATVVDQTFKVIATQSGSHILNSLGFEATFVFGNNRSGTTKLLPVKIAPEQLAIDVKAKPADSDLVWLPTSKLTLSQQWLNDQGNPVSLIKQPLELKLGDSITRQLTLTIQGIEAENFPDISLIYPDAVRHYSEKPQFKTLDNGQTQMTIRQVLIAQHAGKAALPPISIPWFDTQNDVAKQTQVDGVELNIEAVAITANPEISAPINTTQQVVTQSGFWPYLTILFALLWLITLLWHVNSRNKNTAINTTTENHANEFKQVISTVESNDTVQIQYAVKHWLTTQKGKNDQIEQQILAELSIMATKQYSAHPDKWNNHKLIDLIKKLYKQRANNQNSNNLTKL